MTDYVGPIEQQALHNIWFRQVLYTGAHVQLVAKCLGPGEDIGYEVHPNIDQYFHIELGQAKFLINKNEERIVREGDAVVVPAGTYHNVINMSNTASLKLYTLYSPPNHPETVHRTSADAEGAEAVGHR